MSLYGLKYYHPEYWTREVLNKYHKRLFGISLDELDELEELNKSKGESMTETQDQVLTAELIPSNLPSITQVENEYKEKIDSIKKNKSWMRWIVAGGISLGALFLASLAASHIISGAIALGAAGLVLAGGYFGFKLIKNYDPLIQKKMQNHVMRKLIEEAQEKKIETLTLYVKYLDDYLSYTKKLRNKVDALIEKYKSKLNTEDEVLKKEYMNLISKLAQSQAAIERIIDNSKKKKEDFERKLKIAREKYNFVKETQDIVGFLQNSNKLDEILVDESLGQLEKEFQEISVSIQNLAKDINE